MLCGPIRADLSQIPMVVPDESSEPSTDQQSAAHATATKATDDAMTILERRRDSSSGPLSVHTPGELQVLSLLGEGGMGKVYLAFDPVLEREVALKELSEELAQTEQFRQGFIAEARITAGLHHPGILPVHSLSVDPNGSLKFTMQAVRGKNLRDWMDGPDHPVGSQQRLELGLEILLKIGEALAYAHSRGVLHCDVKPDNIMVGEYGSYYLMDWGLSRPLEHEVTQGICGTPAYMPPEQARNERLDERSDVFGFGATLLELVTGKTPYGENVGESCQARAARNDLNGVKEALSATKVTSRLAEIIQRALAARRDDRYPSVTALRNDLRAFLLGGFHLPRREFAAGSLLVREGEREDAAYLLVNGRCRVFREIDGKEVTLREIGPGEILGELSLLLGSARTASIVAETDCVALVIDRATIESSGAMTGWTAALMRALAQRFREMELRLDKASSAR